MIQKEKELLRKDLCARLPYGVIVTDNRYGNSVITEIDTISDTVYCYNFDEYVPIEKCRSYLRPMSSMTEEEIKELSEIDQKRIIFSARHLTWHLDGEVIDYLNEKMFDWRELIPKGLAIEAKDGMYK